MFLLAIKISMTIYRDKIYSATKHAQSYKKTIYDFPDLMAIWILTITEII